MKNFEDDVATRMGLLPSLQFRSHPRAETSEL
jgi:hypothetical protein